MGDGRRTGSLRPGRKARRSRSAGGAAAHDFLTLAVAALCCFRVDAAPPPDTDRLLTSRELQEAVAHPHDGLASQTFWNDDRHQFMTAARSAPGEAEWHERYADLFVVQSGTADVLLGGKVVGNRVTAPGERRGGEIVGGHVRRIGVGDVLWIPAGTPHKVVPLPDAPFRYVVVKIAKPEAAN